MGGAQIGVWCAHGEGRAHFPSDAVKQRVLGDSLAPIRCAVAGLGWAWAELAGQVLVLGMGPPPAFSSLPPPPPCSPEPGHCTASLCCRYCNAEGEATSQYPFNPNGSPEGIAALCSPDGRHLAMMPHPERCFLTWQQPWYPADAGLDAKGPGPWLKLFQNAREWCESHPRQ